MKKIFTTLLLFLSLIGMLQAKDVVNQVVNSYGSVKFINQQSATVSLHRGELTQFPAGGQVMLIQMKGAQINLSNDEQFGNLEKLNEVGLYEFAVIAQVQNLGKEISYTFEKPLKNKFFAGAGLQMIFVPRFAQAFIPSGDTLTCLPWDPITQTGGVLVLSSLRSIELQGSIIVSGKGYKGGTRNAFQNDGPNNGTTFFGGKSLGYGGKGESVTDLGEELMFARGKNAAGGGGGNGHNGGGGGGANFTSGGKGGNNWRLFWSPGTHAFGYAGEGLQSQLQQNPNRLIMGSGGGAGQQNNEVGSAGANGGGIVILMTDTLKVGLQSAGIQADGGSALSSLNDGAGGGGAGGMVMLSARAIYQAENRSLIVSVSGGNGGNVTAPDAHGAGGGGGLGAVLMANGSISNKVFVVARPGIAGFDCRTGCSKTAEDGKAPVNRDNLKVFVPELSGDVIPLVIGVNTYSIARANSQVNVSWQAVNEGNGAKYEIYFSQDSSDWSLMFEQEGASNEALRKLYNAQISEGNWQKELGFYVRLVQKNKEGEIAWITHRYLSKTDASFLAFPNMVERNEAVMIQKSRVWDNKEVLVSLFALNGAEVYKKTMSASAFELFESGELSKVQTGRYEMVLSASDGSVRGRQTIVIK